MPASFWSLHNTLQRAKCLNFAFEHGTPLTIKLIKISTPSHDRFRNQTEQQTPQVLFQVYIMNEACMEVLISSHLTTTGRVVVSGEEQNELEMLMTPKHKKYYDR